MIPCRRSGAGIPQTMMRIDAVARRNRRTGLKRSDYLDREDYLRDLLRSGGPDLGDLDSLGAGAGFYSQLLTTVWGRNEEEFTKAVEHEHVLEQQRRPHLFIRKWQTRRR